jgi:hypothetical protein
MADEWARAHKSTNPRDCQDVWHKEGTWKILEATFDPTRDPIDLLPLRPWEVRMIRARLAELHGEPPAPTREARAVTGNVIEAHRAALAEYDATSWIARFRRSRKRLTAIRSHRQRVVDGLWAVSQPPAQNH